MGPIKIVYQIKPMSYYKTLGWTRRGRCYVTKDGKEFRNFIRIETRRIMEEQDVSMFTTPVKMNIKFYHDNKRKNDLDNSMKTIGDSLNLILYEDDTLIEDLHLSKFYDKKNPRIELFIEPMMNLEIDTIDHIDTLPIS